MSVSLYECVRVSMFEFVRVHVCVCECEWAFESVYMDIREYV